MPLDLQTTIGDLVKERPARSRVFERLQIDYCCGGKLPLSDACAALKLDPAMVLRELQESDAQVEPTGASLADADAMSLTDLANHIEQVHHGYLRRELPRLDALTQKVANVHGPHDARLHDVRKTFVSLYEEFTSHTMKEEQILFPIIRQLEAATEKPSFHCGSVANPIQQMHHEHDVVGEGLARLNELTDGYKLPAWGCNSYRSMLDGLKQLEWDTHQHIHKENNVLFPKAIQLETELAAGAKA